MLSGAVRTSSSQWLLICLGHMDGINVISRVEPEPETKTLVVPKGSPWDFKIYTCSQDKFCGD
jgi:hypothetical protein